jgi:short-subunit dehydrogenase
MTGLERYDFTTGTALVTGAAGGIGGQLALGLAARGSNLVLLDRDAQRLEEVAATIRDRDPQVGVETHVIDVADRPALLELAARIAADHPELNLLVNNAGVALGGNFEHTTLDEFDWVMDINFRAPVALVHCLLPTLVANPGSHIVNMSSLFGIIAPAGQSAYSSSKFALRGFSDVLRTELAEHSVGVTVVHPGGIRTQIATSARIAAGAHAAEVESGIAAVQRLLRYPPERAAAEILSGVHRRRARVLVTPEAVVGDLAARLAPVRHAGLLDGVTRVMTRVTNLR